MESLINKQSLVETSWLPQAGFNGNPFKGSQTHILIYRVLDCGTLVQNMRKWFHTQRIIIIQEKRLGKKEKRIENKVEKIE